MLSVHTGLLRKRTVHKCKPDVQANTLPTYFAPTTLSDKPLSSPFFAHPFILLRSYVRASKFWWCPSCAFLKSSTRRGAGGYVHLLLTPMQFTFHTRCVCLCCGWSCMSTSRSGAGKQALFACSVNIQRMHL